jgi:ribosomal protein L37AE/L43A
MTKREVKEQPLSTVIKNGPWSPQLKTVLTRLHKLASGEEENQLKLIPAWATNQPMSSAEEHTCPQCGRGVIWDGRGNNMWVCIHDIDCGWSYKPKYNAEADKFKLQIRQLLDAIGTYDGWLYNVSGGAVAARPAVCSVITKLAEMAGIRVK